MKQDFEAFFFIILATLICVTVETVWESLVQGSISKPNPYRSLGMLHLHPYIEMNHVFELSEDSEWLRQVFNVVWLILFFQPLWSKATLFFVYEISYFRDYWGSKEDSLETGVFGEIEKNNLNLYISTATSNTPTKVAT